MLFGTYLKGVSNTIIYKSVLDQHYGQILFEADFIKLFKLHLDHGLTVWGKSIDNSDVTIGEHIDILMRKIKTGLSLKSASINVKSVYCFKI